MLNRLTCVLSRVGAFDANTISTRQRVNAEDSCDCIDGLIKQRIKITRAILTLLPLELMNIPIMPTTNEVLESFCSSQNCSANS